MTAQRGSADRAATIKDVAAAAGVGIATVSRVLSGTGSASAATRDRVLSAARALEYRPNALGRGLKLRRTGGIGLVVPDITDPFCAELAAGVLDGARGGGEHVLLEISGDDPEREAELAGRLTGGVDGLIVQPAGPLSPWAPVLRTGLPVVFAGRAPHTDPEDAPHPPPPVVLSDDQRAVRAVVEYLTGLGHRRIGLLGVRTGPADAPVASVTGTAAVFRTALAEQGVTADDDLMVASRPNRDSALAAAAGLLQRRDDMTAVVAAGHLPAEAVVLIARELQLRVPADLSIVMLDDVPWAELCDPPLTAVARPARAMGRRAHEMLHRDLAGASPGRARRPAPEPLPAELVIRGSCGPPAAARGRRGAAGRSR